MRRPSGVERVYLKDRTDLAVMIGHLLGCHADHKFVVRAGALALDLEVFDLQCAQRAPVRFRLTMAEKSSAIWTTPPPPPPPPPVPPSMSTHPKRRSYYID